MLLRTILLLVGVYLILFFLTRSLKAFFRQVGGKQPPPKVPKQEKSPTLQFRKEDVEEAEFREINDGQDKEESSDKQ
jgi:hypothetical protein